MPAHHYARLARLSDILHVDENGLRAYLARYEATYREAVETYIEPTLWTRLDRYPLLSQRLRGYVSTSFGVAYEYVDEPRTAGIETLHGSAPIDTLVFRDAPSHVRNNAIIVSGGQGSGAMGITFDGALPVRLTSSEADFTLSDVAVSGGSWHRSIRHMELFGDRSAGRWSETEAVSRAKDEVMVAMLDQARFRTRDLDLGDYLARFKQRVVLVLGDFKKGRERLNTISTALERLGYEPVLLDEVPEGLDYDLPQKFAALAHVCRFMVFDDSNAAGQLWEMATARGSGLIRIVLREEGKLSSFMSVGQDLTSSVVTELEYSTDNVASIIGTGVEWAEERIRDLQAARAEVYPWRSAPKNK